MIDRNAFKEITWECDACCDTLPTDEEDFHNALAIAKRDGWSVRKVVNEWMHFCPACKNVR